MIESTLPPAGVFLDRDGVINKIMIRNGIPGSPRNLYEFKWEDGVKDALRKLKNRGLYLIVVTNQPDISRGKMSQKTLDIMTQMIYSSMEVDSVYICPHDDLDSCNCRKPKPGMILDAARDWRIDCNRSFMIGDSWKDMKAGQAAGCKTILLNRFYNQGINCDYRLSSLKDAADLILGIEAQNMC